MAENKKIINTDLIHRLCDNLKPYLKFSPHLIRVTYFQVLFRIEIVTYIDQSGSANLKKVKFKY